MREKPRPVDFPASCARRPNSRAYAIRGYRLAAPYGKDTAVQQIVNISTEARLMLATAAPEPNSRAVTAKLRDQMNFRWAYWFDRVILGGLVFALSACSAVAPLVPKDGPSADSVRFYAQGKAPEPDTKPPYILVALNPAIVRVVNTVDESEGLGRFFGKGAGNSKVAIGVGDVLSVTVFEAQSGGLFLPADSTQRQGNYTPIPNQQVDSSGNINIPFIGPVRIAGMTPDEASRMIAKRLNGRAIEPQVVVSMVERRSSAISVLGEVSGPTRFFLDPGGIRLLDAIARAGGAKRLPFETVVTVQRRGSVGKVLLSSVIKNPSRNINLEAGDTIELTYRPKVFMAFGSTVQVQQGVGYSRRFPFESENMTLAEGLSRAGGLDQARADAKSVFLLRLERRDVLAQMNVDTAGYPADLVPTVYAVDLSSSDGFFEMNQMQMRGQDMILATDAPMADATKLLAFIGLGTNIFYQAAYSAQNLH